LSHGRLCTHLHVRLRAGPQTWPRSARPPHQLAWAAWPRTSPHWAIWPSWPPRWFALAVATREATNAAPITVDAQDTHASAWVVVCAKDVTAPWAAVTVPTWAMDPAVDVTALACMEAFHVACRHAIAAFMATICTACMAAVHVASGCTNCASSLSTCSASTTPVNCVLCSPASNVIWKGTESFRKRRNKTHTLCVRCGRRSFHLQKSRCSSCGYPSSRIRKCNLSSCCTFARREPPLLGSSMKAILRKTTGTGRMRYLRHVPRRFKTGFREGTQAAPTKQSAASP
ncbi:hypothetical protein Taro_043310, partial [Colocasia esculenta]|nr:hypothetical protein [Colocasia esculenta]